MRKPAFLIGRFLSLADTLHAEYCEVVRDGDMPPQLLGNALVPTAIQEPEQRAGANASPLLPVSSLGTGKEGNGAGPMGLRRDG